MSIDYSALSASDGNGESVRATVQVNRSIGSTTLTVDHTTHWPVTECIVTTGSLLSTGKLDPTTVQVFYGTASGTTITINSFAAGYSDLGNKQNDVAVIKPTTEWANAVAAAAQAMNTFVSTNGDWRTIATPNTVTALGNRSYSLVFNNTDLTGTLSPGMRLRTTRTVAAPTQCTSLNGSTQYYSKTSPAGMTFTNNFVVSAWIKLSSYPAAQGSVASRYNGTSGWRMDINSAGQVELAGFNAGSANYCIVNSYQAIPLNKWVHVAAQLDMTSTTNSPTVNYVMIDGVDVPATVSRGGTNPTALIQAGDLNIGADNATRFFPGKIAQVAIYSAKVTEANILATISQGLIGTEASLISAYSFNNSINDLNANANNLTANGSAVATNADSPFGGQADGSISATKNYAIITKTAFSTNTTLTVQVPEGCAIATTGGLSAVEYSVEKAPYGMPIQRTKWTLIAIDVSGSQQNSAVSGTWYNISSFQLNVPIGEWRLGYQSDVGINATSTTYVSQSLSTSSSSESDRTFTATAGFNASTGNFTNPITKYGAASLSSATPYYLITRQSGGTSVTLYSSIAVTSIAPVIIEAELAYI